MHLARPEALFLLLFLVPLVLNYRRRPPSLGFPSLTLARAVRRSRWSALRHLLFALRCLALVLIVVGLARPQANAGPGTRSSEGLDIVLVLDTSGSMQTHDYLWQGSAASRIQVVKSVISDFVRQRPDDRVGMVVFGTEAFTQAPLTLDHEVLLRFIDRIKVGMAGEATAMGDGMATAVNRLQKVTAPSKVAILLTDGGSNAGRVDPLAAAQAAATMGVKIYTIGVGAASAPGAKGPGSESDLDEEVLQKIAAATKAQYFRAADTETLIQVYETIDKLEKSKIKVETFDRHEERYHPWIAAAGLLLLMEMLVSLTRLRRIP